MDVDMADKQALEDLLLRLLGLRIESYEGIFERHTPSRYEDVSACLDKAYSLVQSVIDEIEEEV